MRDAGHRKRRLSRGLPVQEILEGQHARLALPPRPLRPPHPHSLATMTAWSTPGSLGLHILETPVGCWPSANGRIHPVLARLQAAWGRAEVEGWEISS